MEITHKDNIRGQTVSLSDSYLTVKADISREPELLPGLCIKGHVAVYLTGFAFSFPVAS